MQITGLQRLGTSIVLHNGDDLMRQMRASLRLLAAAHDSCLDGVAAHFGAEAVRSSRYTVGVSRTSDLRVRDLWLCYNTSSPLWNKTNIMIIRYGDYYSL